MATTILLIPSELADISKSIAQHGNAQGGDEVVKGDGNLAEAGVGGGLRVGQGGGRKQVFLGGGGVSDRHYGCHMSNLIMRL